MGKISDCKMQNENCKVKNIPRAGGWLGRGAGRQSKIDAHQMAILQPAACAQLLKQLHKGSVFLGNVAPESLDGVLLGNLNQQFTQEAAHAAPLVGVDDGDGELGSFWFL